MKITIINFIFNLHSVTVIKNFIGGRDKEMIEMITKELDNSHTNILLIDDEECLVKLWKKVIERRGYSVTSFTRGLQALEEFKANPFHFDIVITDQSMPEITGFELATEIIKIRSDMRIIICSGYLGDIDKAVNKEIGDILLKPFDSNALIEAIERNLMM